MSGPADSNRPAGPRAGSTGSAHPRRLSLRDLARAPVHAIDIRPAADEIEALRRALDLVALRKLSFRGELRALDDGDWALRAHLGATVVQPCVVTLEPVTTRLEEDVVRRFTATAEVHREGEAIEMPEDDTREALGTGIDPDAVMAEALALALPQYPRLPGASLASSGAGTGSGAGAGTGAASGTAPGADENDRPFSALAALRDKLAKDRGTD